MLIVIQFMMMFVGFYVYCKLLWSTIYHWLHFLKWWESHQFIDAYFALLSLPHCSTREEWCPLSERNIAIGAWLATNAILSTLLVPGFWGGNWLRAWKGNVCGDLDATLIHIELCIPADSNSYYPHRSSCRFGLIHGVIHSILDWQKLTISKMWYEFLIS